MPLTAANVMDHSAALINDPNKITYTYAKMLPYLRMAYLKAQNRLGLLGHQSLAIISSGGLVTAGSDKIENVDGLPALDALIEPVFVFERTVGGNDNDWFIMEPVKWEDLREPREQLETWAWRQGYVKFTPATTDREVKVFYRGTFNSIIDENTVLSFPIFRDFLENATAGLIAEFVMKDKSRAAVLNSLAGDALDVAVVHSVKIMQKHPVKRRSYFFGR